MDKTTLQQNSHEQQKQNQTSLTQQKFIAVDADSVDKDVRAIILKAVVKNQLPCVFVADRELADVQKASLATPVVKMQIVQTADDEADNWIFNHATSLHFCISHDVILAHRLEQVGVQTLDKRGNIIQQGYMSSEKAHNPRTSKDREKFANSFFKLVNSIILASK